jgi:hypothetical protein
MKPSPGHFERSKGSAEMSNNDVSIFISHAQLAVFNHTLERPFNLWTDRHVAQGFSWRPGSVSFGTVEESGVHLVSFKWQNFEDQISDLAIRVIDVPFEVENGEKVEIGSISDSTLVDVPAGIYQLRFECYGREGDDPPRIQLIFFRTNEPVFRVVKADPELAPEHDLFLTADPA